MLCGLLELAWGLLYRFSSRGDELQKKVQKISPEDMANHQSHPTKNGPPHKFTVLSPARLKLKKSPSKEGLFFFQRFPV
jgi:uncharacterized ferritin-like protein (DUF455 family)